jgi:hypothetical protein
LVFDGSPVDEIAGSAGVVVSGSGSPVQISGVVIISVAASQTLKLQVGTNTAGFDLNSYDDVNLPDPATSVAAHIAIDRISS